MAGETYDKVQFGLKNVHYAVLTDGETPTWGTPVAVPGAVSLSLDQSGSDEPFYADNVIYYKSSSNSGYEGDLELAYIPDEMLKDIWGFEVSAENVVVESSNQKSAEFALMFEVDGDATGRKYMFYRCSATRPAVASATKEDTTTPQTSTVTISCMPLIESGIIKAHTTPTTTTTAESGWYTSVVLYEPAN